MGMMVRITGRGEGRGLGSSGAGVWRWLRPSGHRQVIHPQVRRQVECFRLQQFCCFDEGAHFLVQSLIRRSFDSGFRATTVVTTAATSLTSCRLVHGLCLAGGCCSSLFLQSFLCPPAPGTQPLAVRDLVFFQRRVIAILVMEFASFG